MNKSNKEYCKCEFEVHLMIDDETTVMSSSHHGTLIISYCCFSFTISSLPREKYCRATSFPETWGIVIKHSI